MNVQDSGRKIHYDTIASPVGKILIAVTARGLFELHYPLRGSAEKFVKRYADPPFSFHPLRSKTRTARVKTDLRRYFQGDLRRFTLPLDLRGTPFQMKVWKKLRKIPFGKTRSYGELAKRIGCPKAARAVGTANNKNRIGIVVPCHRVIGSNGHLVGYASGLGIKAKLLKHESAVAATGGRPSVRVGSIASRTPGPAEAVPTQSP